jgi:hypothetical protein
MSGNMFEEGHPPQLIVILNEVKDLSDHGPLSFRTGRKAR